MRQQASGSMDENPSHDSHPPSTYPANGTAQYSSSQYAYPPATAPYPIDSALVMPQHYEANDASSIDARLHSDASLASTNGHAPQRPLHALSMPQPMPTHNAQSQPLTPTAMKRKSTEDAQDTDTPSGDPKRKRSKVSRACDQCRKKKIRCDADTENGVLKTCSNCTKAGQLCEYSRIPQKRGPSKGYIKELSERVQQVEGQLALQSSATYRSSVDGATATVYPDHFSPDDDPNSNFRRQSSFSQQRNPFADFPRDRFPIVGGWTNAAAFNQSLSKDRDRGSVAIPPDQQPSSATSQSFARPFWHEWFESPPKRRKLSREGEDEMATLELNVDILGPYYTHIKPKGDFLPDFEITASVLRECSPSCKAAFLCALRLLPNSNSVTFPIQSFNSTRDTLRSFLDGQHSVRTNEQSDQDNLVLIWICILTAIVEESSLHNQPPTISPYTPLQIAVETYHSLHATGNDFLSGPMATLHKRAMPFVWLLVRLHCFANGRADDHTPSSLFQSSSKAAASLGHTLAYEFSAAHMLLGLLSLNQNIHQSTTHYIQLFRKTATIMSDNMHIQFGSDADLLTANVIHNLLHLVQARVDTQLFPPDISTPAANLTESLRLQSEAEAAKPWQYDPIRYHAYTIATFTLLELHQNIVEDDVPESYADKNLRNLQSCLQRESEKIGPITDAVSPATWNWASLLGKLIEVKLNQSNGHAKNNKHSEVVSTVNFSDLLKTGYTRLMGMWSDHLNIEDGNDRNPSSVVDPESAPNSHSQDRNGPTGDVQSSSTHQANENVQ